MDEFGGDLNFLYIITNLSIWNASCEMPFTFLLELAAFCEGHEQHFINVLCAIIYPPQSSVKAQKL